MCIEEGKPGQLGKQRIEPLRNEHLARFVHLASLSAEFRITGTLQPASLTIAVRHTAWAEEGRLYPPADVGDRDTGPGANLSG